MNGKPTKYLAKQIEGALYDKDHARASRCQILLHDLETEVKQKIIFLFLEFKYLTVTDNIYFFPILNVFQAKSYKPETSGALKTPMDWSHGSQKKANTMHTWQSSTLSEPFTRKYDTILDTTMKKNVKKMILHQFNTGK